MTVTVSYNQTVRIIHITMERERIDRHQSIEKDFLRHGIWFDCRRSGPAPIRGTNRLDTTKVFYILEIEEEHADEYLRRIEEKEND